ncbi:MAG: amidohydrolase family protein [Acidaminococcales bacterium]|nr:amidohydrolase family protein [Acidaminococcales bacterium]
MNANINKRAIRFRRMIDTLLSANKNECADIVLTNGRLVNVITREIYAADVAIKDEYILLTGDCSGVAGPRTRIIDLSGGFICPGFIDAHMHFESSMLTLSEFSKLSILSGTTTLIADPHEIANVAGIEGMRAMIDEAAMLPNRILFTIPCMVPDAPGLETAGASVTSENVGLLLGHDLVQGIGEMQGFSNVKPVYEHAPSLIDDLLASVSLASELKKTVEGNAPGLSGRDLAAHILACGGNTSCHETTSKAECVEKLRNNITVFMREGSTQKNMAECIKAVTEDGLDSRKLVLATDDMLAQDLLDWGHMNEIVRRTIEQGIDPVEAIQMATINAAGHFALNDIGTVAPGKIADLAIVDDLAKMTVKMVLLNGSVAARDGELLLAIPPYKYPDRLKHTMRRADVKYEDLFWRSAEGNEKVDVIKVIPNQNLTGREQCVLPVKDGIIAADPGQDAIYIFVIERHGAAGRTGKGFVKGFGLEKGAIALSVAHDAHNIVACGVNLNDVALAANRVIRMGGGVALINESKVLGDMALPVAGLMTDELTGREVSEKIASLERIAAEQLGCKLAAPFMHLSFLTLVTSPELKISDKGMLDTVKHEFLHGAEKIPPEPFILKS